MADSGRLPVQLLAYVLGKLGPQEVLQSCALVSSSWNKAAALCISEIALPGCNQAKAAALRSWLQTHGAAAITSMTVCGDHWGLPGAELLLPVQQLTALQSLDLKYLRVGPAPAAGGGGADDAPVLDPGLSGVLTRLQLDGCTVQLQGLPALTNLRRLGLSMLMDPADGGAASNLGILAEAVPRLQQLTDLCLGCRELQAATLSGLSCLTKLQRLNLSLRGYIVEGALELPPSLTAVTIRDNWEVPPPAYDSISGLRALTALEEAELPVLGRHRFQGGVAALAALTSLTKLTLTGCRLGTDGATLRVLTALTRLQCFQLGRLDADVVPLDADFAAVTSSPALEYLELTTDIGPDCAQAMCPPQRQCNNLHDLSLDMTWLAEAGAMAHVTAACPRLEHLKLHSFGQHLFGIPATAWAAGLTALHKLTFLSLSTLDVEMAPAVFASLATLTNLRVLSLGDLDSNYLGGVLRLTSCSQLTRLKVTCMAVDGDEDVDLSIDITSKAPVDSPPDVWQQIPSLVLQQAEANFEALLDDPEALRSLLQASTSACSYALQQQAAMQQEVQDLQQRMAQMEDRLGRVLASLPVLAAGQQ